ncbi:hypothetical protein F4679DRAFT_576687 [Xylaria curta]|nr:hypothetical protein F4679DRAFT_576687 [Xylaria curta]
MDSFISSTPENSVISTNNSFNSSNLNNEKYKNSKYNQPNFSLEKDEDSRAYIFKNKLFTRILLPIDLNKKQEVIIKCTLCYYSKKEKIQGFITSNFTKHYIKKHPTIAYNIETEKTKTKRLELPGADEFFNLTDNRKRPRINTIQAFNENDAYEKILNFLIENNISINTFSPVINRKKIKNFYFLNLKY